MARPLRPAAAAMAALGWCSRGAAAAKRGGGKHWWALVVPKPTSIRAEDRGEGCSVVAGGGDGERWRCRLEKEGLGGGVGYGEGGGAWGGAPRSLK